MRLKIIRLVIFALFGLLAAQLFYMQVIRGRYYHQLSVNNRIRVIPLQGHRGRILDRNGVVLADNRLTFDVTVIPQDIHNKHKLFTYLSGVLKTGEKKLLRRFWLKRVTPFAPVTVAEAVGMRKAIALEENKFRFPGLYIRENFRRHYPFGAVGAHVLGYVGTINRSRFEQLKGYGYTPQSVVGYSGAEEYYGRYMKGKEGGLQIEVNSRGQQVRLLGFREPESGRDIQLTVDERVQQIASDVLGDRRGAIIVMAMHSGEILGLVSHPSYDPNWFVDPNDRKKAAELFVDAGAPLLNRAIQGQYPSGSVFKVVDTTAALENAKITTQTTFFCPGYYMLGHRKFHCERAHHNQDLIQAIAHSCNVYFYHVGLLTGPELLTRYAHMYGLGKKTHIDLPFEEKGNIPIPSRFREDGRGWSGGDTLNYAIGQGRVLVTPIQLVKMMATVANNGTEVQPHLIKRIGSKDIVIPPAGHLRISQHTFDILHKGLRSVVTDSAGTARHLNMQGFYVAGKTGTAQAGHGKKDDGWFVGYEINLKQPIVFCVFLEHGGSSYYSVMLAKEMLKRMKKEGII